MDMGSWHDPRFGWWGRHGPRHGRYAGRRLRRGILKFVLLKFLADAPRHGYELIRAFREKGWGAGAGSVYPLLTALEAAGLIAGRDEGERRVYDITDKGRRLLEEHAAELGRFFEEDDQDEGAGGDIDAALRDSVDRLLVSVWQLGPSAKAQTLERVRDLLDRARKEIYTLLAQE